jgi:VWFA-related protein
MLLVLTDRSKSARVLMLKVFRIHLTATIVPLLSLLFLSAASSISAQSDSSAPTPGKQDPQLKLRPTPAADDKKAPEGKVRLDVVVTDASGNPISGFGPQDFHLSDNGRPQSIVSFHASDGAPGKPDSLVSVLLVIDTVNSGLTDVSTMRGDAEIFLRQNGGHLAQPVTVLLLTDAGFEVVGQTTVDGNLLAQKVHEIKPVVHTVRSAAGGEALVERFQLSAKALDSIVAHETGIPGRKLMIWMGPGWPLLPKEEVTYNARVHALNYEALAELSNQIREARMVLCSAGGRSEFFVRDYLKPVKSERDANSANLALQVLAMHSGGRTLDPGNHGHFPELLNTCMKEAGAYYTLTFDPSSDPSHPEKPMEYHALQVGVGKPGLTVRTSAGYYAEP